MTSVTLGMATVDDFHGVFFTVQHARLTNPLLKDRLQILVVDNNPGSPHGKETSKLVANARGLYIPNTDWQSTASRDLVFRHAQGDIVVCVDSHVLLEPFALERLVEYADANPDSRDLWQGPMLYDCLNNLSTHMEPVWRAEMFGIWGLDNRGWDLDSVPFEIPMHGLGAFACRREAWPGFNPLFRGFGGEEGYIHDKFRQRGSKTMCLPFFRWVHRFGQPDGRKYSAFRDDKVANYLIGRWELGLDIEDVRDHFSASYAPEQWDVVVKRTRLEYELSTMQGTIVELVAKADELKDMVLQYPPDEQRRIIKRLSHITRKFVGTDWLAPLPTQSKPSATPAAAKSADLFSPPITLGAGVPNHDGQQHLLDIQSLQSLLSGKRVSVRLPPANVPEQRVDPNQ